MIKQISVLTFLVAIGFSFNHANAEPSFDCGYVKKAAEKAICDYDRLGKLDKTVAGKYLAAMRTVPKEQKSQVRWEQRAWVVTRNKCGYSSGCLALSYQDRMERLAYWENRYK